MLNCSTLTCRLLLISRHIPTTSRIRAAACLSTFVNQKRAFHCRDFSCQRDIVQGNRFLTCGPRTLSSPFRPTSSYCSVPVTAPSVDQNQEKEITMAVDKDLKHYVLPVDQPVVALDCSDAYEGLSAKEKLYAHHLSQASWVGGLIVLVQTSPEAPVLFSLLHDLFKTTGTERLKGIAMNECEFTEDDWKAFLVYTGGVFQSMGNYKNFGDTKFVPGLPVEKIARLLEKSNFDGMKKEDVLSNWESVKEKMYSLTPKERQLGLGEKGITTYFSANCDNSDAERVVKFLKSAKLEAWNTRCFKKVDGSIVTYEIRSASSEMDDTSKLHIITFEGANYMLTKGDYSPLMCQMNCHLQKAKEFASNEVEQKMIDCYIKSFKEGSVDSHKDGSRFWIKDKGPAIETYIGFIENYRDPTGLRSEFESFVAVVNHETSKKFVKLVERAPEILPLLPWPKEFEKEVFLKPDFTSLDVLTFSGSGIPAGINIPNYDEIRQNEGFKNVSLGNVILSSYKSTTNPFLSAEDKEMIEKYRVPSFGVQVAYHELLGHGSGKLLKKNEDGTINYSADVKNPLTGQLVESCYDHNDTYDSIFGDIGSAFEECRAECVGLLLSLDKGFLKEIFGFDGEEADNVIYTNWLSMVYAGVKALEMYQPDAKQWMQAHSQARFSILNVLVEAGEGFVQVKETVGEDGKPDLLVQVDRSGIDTIGRKAINDYLLKIQVYKATANIKCARDMFAAYTAVNNDGKFTWGNWREIVMDRKQPRKFFVQHNTVLNGDNVTLKTYEATQEGLIQSWIDRFPNNSIYSALDCAWKKDKGHF